MTRSPRLSWRGLVFVLVVCVAAASVLGGLIPMTLEDFHLSGTQVGDVQPSMIFSSNNCKACHGYYDTVNAPYETWKGSLMGNAGRDPLFFAQMATANQDVTNVGYFCMRCHVPMTFVTTHAYQPDGSTLDNNDRDGVNCHFCHSMVDPIYNPGVSPAVDQSILGGMTDVPAYYGNSMFVLDPQGTRRGPYTDAQPMHTFEYSPFHKSGNMCGTCHDVGNVALTRQPNGTYTYNGLNQRTPSENPHNQFPLERTFTEWKLSAFANGGVDMGGRFGGTGPAVVSSCQDCHMPKTTARGAFVGPIRSDLARHDFAGASSWVLDIIRMYYASDPEVSQTALVQGSAKAVDMLTRAASLQLTQECGALKVRVINESGHKLPTGHIEGRRVWINVRFLDASQALVGEYGRYDLPTAELDEHSTHVYEMKIGLSSAAAALTGYPVGETTHMSVADTIVKDNRIPPRGFANAPFENGGAPVVGVSYADGQFWDDAHFSIPAGAVRAEVTVNYQTVTRHYIEALKNGNVTDQWGNILHNLWEQTGKAPPIPMTTSQLELAFVRPGDFDCDGDLDAADLASFISVLTGLDVDARHAAIADMNHSGVTDGADVRAMVDAFLQG